MFSAVTSASADRAERHHGRGRAILQEHAQRIVRVDHEKRPRSEVFEELLLFLQGVLQTAQTADVSLTDYRQYAVIRSDHPFQALHFARPADACLDDRHLMFGPHPEKAERCSDLGVVRKRRTVRVPFQTEDCRKHLLDERLAIASCHAYDRTRESTSIG